MLRNIDGVYSYTYVVPELTLATSIVERFTTEQKLEQTSTIASKPTLCCFLTIPNLLSTDRPYSESDIPQTAPPQTQQCRRSASSPPLTLTLDSDLEDDVFTPRSDRTNDLFSTRNLDIFGYGSPRTPAGVLLSPRRERKFTFSMTSEKHWRDKGGTDVADGVTRNDGVSDTDSDRDTDEVSVLFILFFFPGGEDTEIILD